MTAERYLFLPDTQPLTDVLLENSRLVIYMMAFLLEVLSAFLTTRTRHMIYCHLAIRDFIGQTGFLWTVHFVKSNQTHTKECNTLSCIKLSTGSLHAQLTIILVAVTFGAITEP